MVIETRYRKQSDEDYDSYCWRICSNKELGIYNLTWDEVGEILNEELDENYTSSKFRKNYQMMKKGYDKAVSEKLEDDELIEDIEIKKMEIKRERVKLSTLRNDLNKKITNETRFDLWIEEIKREIKDVVVEIPEYRGVIKDDYEKDYLLTIADIHAGRKGESLDNYYDIDVLQDRMWQIRDEVVEIIKEKKIKTLKVLSLGDLIDGLLRVSQLRSLQLSRANQTVLISRFIFEWLNSLSEHCYIDFKMTTASNHSESRPLNSQRGDFKDDDYEIIIYQWLSDLCERNPRIQIEGSPILEFDILGRKCVAMHGHQLPRKTKKSLLSDVSFHMNEQYQYLFTGHLHHTEIMTVGRNDLGNKEVIFCPCICGNDEYSDSLWTGATAGSLFMEFDSKQGRRSITDIILR